MTPDQLSENPARPFAEIPGLHHVGFVVQDIEQAAREWHAMTGIGPFLLFEHLPFDEVLLDGAPVAFDHSAAFAAWGDNFVELQVLHRVEPAAARAHFEPSGPNALSHLAIAVDDRVGTSDRIARRGVPCAVHAYNGPLAISQHAPTASLGFALEVHQRGDFLDGFFGAVAKAAQNWDGAQLVIPTSM
jgi:catechol 2,3-dioxygenase-like lactoylglutathione lyase family enzyme